jgi:hypothetical protein
MCMVTYGHFQVFPASTDDLAELVKAMRDLGVVQAFGVVIGREPMRLEKLQRLVDEAKSTGNPNVDTLENELLKAQAEQELEQKRQNLRDLLSHVDHTYSNEELDRIILNKS